MSKVKRLRKKYRALYSKAQKISAHQTQEENVEEKPPTSNPKTNPLASAKHEKRNQINNLYDMIIDAKGNGARDFDSRSSYSISKSIKSNLSGQSILKKDKRRLKHELFMKKLESSAELMNRLKKSNKKKRRKVNANREVSLGTPNAEKPAEKSLGFVSKNLKTLAKNRDSGKGLTKRRNERMMKDIEQFQNLLGKNSASGFVDIQRRILDRLSLESIESVKVDSKKK